ncbi:MAG: threonine-phosphate decarboxylase [Pseudomonadota bacterium]
MNSPRDHGGGIDAARGHYGGARGDWIDLSTGINPVPYPAPAMPADAWTALPDAAALARLTEAARAFWGVPDGADILAAPGCSAIIAQIPWLAPADRVAIPRPTYNEHAASFAQAGWDVTDDAAAPARVIVHPNNPDGRLWDAPAGSLVVIDESFCDVTPGATLIAEARRPGRIVLKSFGKFWGLAGLRLGFAIGDPALIGALRARLGPWAVSGPALSIGAAALEDRSWAQGARAQLAEAAARLDAMVTDRGARIVGGTSLFRLYDVGEAAAWHDHLARHQILTRVFPYSDRWLRLGLPAPDAWPRVAAALAGINQAQQHAP